jgi:hypothetical protein
MVSEMSGGILEQSMKAKKLEGLQLSCRPARLHRLAEKILGLLKSCTNTIAELEATVLQQ